jgi:hypothetical protein
MKLKWHVKIDYLCPSEMLEARQAEVDLLVNNYRLQVQSRLTRPAEKGASYVRVLARGDNVKPFCRQARKRLPYAKVLAVNQFGVVVKEQDGFFGLLKKFSGKKENGFAPEDISLIKSEAPETKYETDDKLIGINFSYKSRAGRFKTMFEVIEAFREYQVKIRRHEENYERKEIYIVVAAPEEPAFYTKLQGIKAVRARRMLACLVPVKPADHLEDLLKKTFESMRKPA